MNTRMTPHAVNREQEKGPRPSLHVARLQALLRDLVESRVANEEALRRRSMMRLVK